MCEVLRVVGVVMWWWCWCGGGVLVLSLRSNVVMILLVVSGWAAATMYPRREAFIQPFVVFSWTLLLAATCSFLSYGLKLVLYTPRTTRAPSTPLAAGQVRVSGCLGVGAGVGWRVRVRV